MSGSKFQIILTLQPHLFFEINKTGRKNNKMQLKDSEHTYGIITILLHWSLTVLIVGLVPRQSL